MLITTAKVEVPTTEPPSILYLNLIGHINVVFIYLLFALLQLLTCLRRTLVSAACSAFADEFLSQIEDYFLTSYTSVKDDMGGALAAVAGMETSTSDAAADD